MNNITRRRSTGQRRGVAVVEMALVLPLFILLVFGCIEFARMVMVKQTLTDAARAGSRQAILASTIDDAEPATTARNYMQATVPNYADTGICRVNVSPSGLNGMASGTEITTTVEIDFADVSWIPSSFLGSAVLKSESTMRRE